MVINVLGSMIGHDRLIIDIDPSMEKVNDMLSMGSGALFRRGLRVLLLEARAQVEWDRDHQRDCIGQSRIF